MREASIGLGMVYNDAGLVQRRYGLSKRHYTFLYLMGLQFLIAICESANLKYFLFSVLFCFLFLCVCNHQYLNLFSKNVKQETVS